MLILIKTMTIKSSAPLDVTLDLLSVRTIIYALVVAHSLCYHVVVSGSEQCSAPVQSHLSVTTVWEILVKY